MSEKLLPCPFCGHETPEFERMGNRRQSCIVICGNCGARHESGDEGSRNGSSWNQRSEPGQDGLRATLETALARIEDMLADDDGQAFKEARKFLESARSLTASPTAPSTEASEPVATIRYERGTPGKENDMPKVVSCNWLPDGVYSVYTTPPPAPVLSDAEIEQAVKAARHPSGTLTPTDLARAIEQAIGRASRGAK